MPLPGVWSVDGKWKAYKASTASSKAQRDAEVSESLPIQIFFVEMRSTQLFTAPG